MCLHIWGFEPQDEEAQEAVIPEVDHQALSSEETDPAILAQNLLKNKADEILPELQKEENLIHNLTLPFENRAEKTFVSSYKLGVGFALATVPFLMFIFLILSHNWVVGIYEPFSWAYEKIGIKHPVLSKNLKILNVNSALEKMSDGQKLLKIQGEIHNQGATALHIPRLNFIPYNQVDPKALHYVETFIKKINPGQKIKFQLFIPFDRKPEDKDQLAFES
jgi:hypothetical protein